MQYQIISSKIFQNKEDKMKPFLVLTYINHFGENRTSSNRCHLNVYSIDLVNSQDQCLCFLEITYAPLEIINPNLQSSLSNKSHEDGQQKSITESSNLNSSSSNSIIDSGNTFSDKGIILNFLLAGSDRLVHSYNVTLNNNKQPANNPTSKIPSGVITSSTSSSLLQKTKISSSFTSAFVLLDVTSNNTDDHNFDSILLDLPSPILHYVTYHDTKAHISMIGCQNGYVRLHFVQMNKKERHTIHSSSSLYLDGPISCISIFSEGGMDHHSLMSNDEPLNKIQVLKDDGGEHTDESIIISEQLQHQHSTYFAVVGDSLGKLYVFEDLEKNLLFQPSKLNDGHQNNVNISVTAFDFFRKGRKQIFIGTYEGLQIYQRTSTMIASLNVNVNVSIQYPSSKSNYELLKTVRLPFPVYGVHCKDINEDGGMELLILTMKGFHIYAVDWAKVLIEKLKTLMRTATDQSIKILTE